MIKRILTLLLSVLLLTGICVPAMGAEETAAADAVASVADEAADETADETAEEEKAEPKVITHTVVDTADLSVANTAALAASSSYSQVADMTLLWSGEDLKRAVKLPVSRSDWSDSAYLESWIYSVVDTDSAFGLILISDNPETKEIDYYEASVNAAFKGWYLLSIPFIDFTPVNSPKGFNSIDRIELWPNSGSYSMFSSAQLYLDAFTITNTQSETTEINDDMVVADFRSRDGFSRSGAKEDQNKSLLKSPGKETMAIQFTDVIRYGDIPDGLSLNPPDPDLTGYNTAEFVIYNEAPVADGFRLVFRSENSAATGNDYYYYDMALDWTGWKTHQISISAFAKATGKELGWNQINKVEIWWQIANKTVDAITYVETITLKNIDPADKFKKPVYPEDFEAVPDQVDVASIIKQNFPNNQHPRLLLTQDEIDWIKENYATDKFLSKVVPNFLSTCDSKIGKKITVTGTSSPNSASAAADLALAWKLTGDQKYADECWERVKELTYEASTWAGSSFALTLGDTARSAAITYDLMYNDWTEEQRLAMRNAMVLFGINPSKGNVTRHNGVQSDNTNWTPIGNSGMGMVALVLADEPGFENVANGYLNRLHLSNENFFRNFDSDGSGHEGPDYWAYAVSNYLRYEKALYYALGSENSDLYKKFSMTDQYGFDTTAEYITQMHGTTGNTFNYYDGASTAKHVPGMMWLASLYGKPEQGGISYDSAQANANSIFFYDPDVDYSGWRDVFPVDSAWTGGQPQVGTMRTSWAKGNQGFFVGYKGNRANTSTHDRLDTGSFVLESQGTRFIVQIDDANYDLPEMFGNKRFHYYRNRAEGSNTLVIGPGVDQGSNLDGAKKADASAVIDQTYRNVSPITKTASEEWGAYAIIDMTDAYSQTATMAQRGYALIDGRNAFLLQDEITVKRATDVYSFMHTTAKIEVAPDGQSAILDINGKKMKASLLSNCNATLVDMPAEPLSTTPKDVNHEDNSKWRKLTVKASVSSSATFSVLFTPYYGEDQYTYTMKKIVPLKDWNSLLAEPVRLTGIYLDDVLLADFDPTTMLYTLKEDSLGVITATGDANTTIEVKQSPALGQPATITATKGSVSTTYVVNYSKATQEVIDGYTTYVPVDYFASIDRESIPYLFDGSMIMGWWNDGSHWVTYDLGSEKKVFEIEMLWDMQDQRQETFTIEVSNDNKNWTRVWEGESILSNKMEKYKFDEVMARYVKVHGISNPKSSWTSVQEIWVTASEQKFEDVPNDHWAAAAINDMSKVGMVTGVEPGIYSPEAPLSRAAFLTMLSRVYGLAKSEYTGNVPGITEGAWYTPYAETAYAMGLIPEAMLVDGFLPNQNITREEISALAVTFYEHFEKPIRGTSLSKFTDQGSISDWAKPYIEKCLAMRVISGMTDTTFEPTASATRAQAAAILKRVYIKAK